jgi:hypothetical protein
LIRFWLKIEPSDDWEEFGEQAARAANMEERYMDQFAGKMATIMAKLIGG